MKASKRMLVTIAALTTFSSLQAATVMQPAIKPSWSGAKVATWTMDYETAMEKAQDEGKYTLLFFSGMWWCPHCQHLEANVLTSSGWKSFAKANGFYETVLDFPNRAGDGYWCWLWEESYRKTAKLTAEDATREIIKRYDFQNSYSPRKTFQVAKNYVVTTPIKGADPVFTPFEEQPESEYWRVGYPTIIVIDPDGKERGRFSVNAGTDSQTGEYYNPEYMADPLGYVKAQVSSILYPGAGASITKGSQYYGSVVDDGVMAGTVTCKTGKPNKDTNLAALTFTFTLAGKKTTVKTSVYSAENVTGYAMDKVGNRVDFTFGSREISGTYAGIQFVAYRDTLGEGDSEATQVLSSYMGNWSLVVSGDYMTATGCESCGTYEESSASRAFLTVNIGNKGKVKVSGFLSGGSKLSLTAQMSVEGEYLIIPIADSKKLGSAFELVIWASDGTAQIRFPASNEKLLAFNRPAEALEEPLYFSCDDGTAVKLDVNGKKLTCEKIGLSLTYTAKTGVCKGTYKSSGVKVSVNGIFAGSVGYFSAKSQSGSEFNALISSQKPKNYVEDCEECHD